MADAPAPFSFDVDVGIAGEYSLVSFPRLELTPDPPSVKQVADPVTEVALKGKCKGPKAGPIPCRLVWLVIGPDGLQREYSEEGLLKLQGGSYEVMVKPEGSAGEVKPKLDFAAHELMGKGKIGYRLEPTWPMAQALTVDPGVISYDNSIVVVPSLEGEATPMLGSRVVFTLQAKGALEDFVKAGGRATLALKEKRTVPGQKQPKLLPVCSAGWNDQSYGKKLAWHVGNADFDLVEESTSVAPRPLLAYSDTSKTAKHDFVYSLELTTAGEHPATYAIAQDTPLFGVGGARLGQLSLELRTPAVSAMYPITAQDLPRIVARGMIAGISPALGLPLELALWWIRGGKNGVPTVVGTKREIYLTSPSFEATLYTLPIAAVQPAVGGYSSKPLPLIPNAADQLAAFLWSYQPPKSGNGQRILFATLRIPEMALRDAKQPLVAALGYDPKAYDSFDDGKARFVEVSKGRAVCSPESKNGVPFATQAGEKLRSIYGPPRSV